MDGSSTIYKLKETIIMQKNRKKWLIVLTVGAMLLTSVNMPFVKTESRAAGYGISNPRVEKDVLISGDDSEKPEGTISNPVVKADVTTWDCITFGNYWQEDTNGDGKVDQSDEKQPIKWRVLSVDGDDAFLLADQNLDCQPYNTDDTAVTWENCSLRNWLNQDFMNAAFTEEEQNSILETEVVNENNPWSNTDGGNNTKDKVYLLSIAEVSEKAYGFDCDFYDCSDTREANNTKYTNDCGAREDGMWWLRSPREGVKDAAEVDKRGSGDDKGYYVVASTKRAIRPVLHLNLSFLNWKISEKESALGGYQSTWDTVYFGKYWQYDTNGDGKADQNDEKQLIKWRVLSVNNDDVFLLADKNLNCQPYHTEYVTASWESCSIRKWLNKEFVSDAFSKEDQEAIIDTQVVEDVIDAQDDVNDKIYLLSSKEVSQEIYGFSVGFDENSKSRIVQNTQYASACGATMGQMNLGDKLIGGLWWLRSEDTSSKLTDYIQFDGSGKDISVNETNIGIRPVLHISRSSSLWKSAGKVKSYKEEITPTPSPTSPPTLPPTKSPASTASSQPIQSPSVSPASNPSGTATTTPQFTTAPSNAGNQASQLQQTPQQTGADTRTTADPTTEVSLITQSKVSWKSVKNIKSGKVVASWKKVVEADGYQIQYATNKKFKKAKSKTVKSTSVTLKKLKKKKTYFVRVRAYKVADGKKAYGKWSASKKVKIKK